MTDDGVGGEAGTAAVAAASSSTVAQAEVNEPSAPLLKKQRKGKAPADGGNSGPNGETQKRSWEVWTNSQNNLFFENVVLFGRDFDKVAAKLKIKTKEQCRHYHFRQSKRIKQFLQDPEAPEDAVDDKNFNELRAFRCYWELRKKLVKMASKKKPNGKESESDAITPDEKLHAKFGQSVPPNGEAVTLFAYTNVPRILRYLRELMSQGTVLCKKGRRTVTVTEKDPPAARKKAVPVKRKQAKPREGDIARPAHILTPAESAAWWKESLCRDPVIDFVVTDEDCGLPFIRSILTRLSLGATLHPSLRLVVADLHAKFVTEEAEASDVDADKDGAEADAVDAISADEDDGDDEEDDDDEEEDDDASDDDAQPTLSHTQSSPQSGSRSEDGAAVSPPDLDNHQAGSKRSHDVMNIDRNEERVSPLLGGHSPPKLSVSLESASAAKLQTPAAVAPGTRTSGKPQKKVSVVLTPRSERVRDMFSRVKKRSDIAVTTISTKRLCSMIRNLCSHVNWTTAHPGVTVDAVRIYPRLDPSAAAAAIPGVPTEGWSPSESTLQIRDLCATLGATDSLHLEFDWILPVETRRASSGLGRSGQPTGQTSAQSSAAMLASVRPPTGTTMSVATGVASAQGSSRIVPNMPPLVNGVEPQLLGPDDLDTPVPVEDAAAVSAEGMQRGLAPGTHPHYEASIGLSTLMAEPSIDHFGGSIMGLSGMDSLFSGFDNLDHELGTSEKRKAQDFPDDSHHREKHHRTFGGVSAVH